MAALTPNSANVFIVSAKLQNNQDNRPTIVNYFLILPFNSKQKETSNLTIMKICVFCSANWQIDPEFFERAEELGLWAAKNAHSIVFGGHDAGLMHAVSKAAHEAGGQVIGVVPRVIERMGKLSPYLDVHIPTEDLTDRKQLMMDQSDAFIVLPGGIGTLDELFTVMAAATLNYHHKPVMLYNINGFWDSLIACLDDLHKRGVTRKQWRTYIKVVTSLDELQQLLEA